MNKDDSIIIFGSEESVGPSARTDTLSSRRVSVDTVKANMVSALAAVEAMADAAQEVLGTVRVAHMDVELAVGIDGSVGLFGSGVSSSVRGTLTVRIEPNAAN